MRRATAAVLVILAASAAGCASAPDPPAARRSSSTTTAGRPASYGPVTQIACSTDADCIAMGAAQVAPSATGGAQPTSEGPAYTLVSQDGGLTWQPAGDRSSVTSPTALSCWNAGSCLVLGSDGVFETNDGGSSWSRLPGPQDVAPTALSCPAAGTCLVVGTSGSSGQLPTSALAVTTDGGTRWVRHPVPGIGAPLSLSCWAAGSCLVAGERQHGSGSAALRTDDAGSSWAPTGALPLGTVVGLFCAPSGRRCLATFSGTSTIGITTDLAATWTTTTVPIPPPLSQLIGGSCATDTFCFLPTLSPKVAVTWNGGDVFTTPSLGPGVISQSMSCLPSGRCLAGGTVTRGSALVGTIQRSTDGGGSWATVWVGGS